MAETHDSEALIAERRRWIDQSLSWPWKFRYGAGFILWRAIPTLVGAGSGRGLFLIAAQILLTFAVAATPVWVPSLPWMPGSLDASLALWTTLVLGGLMAAKAVFDHFASRAVVDKKAFRLRCQVAALEANLHRELAEITKLADHVKSDKEKEILQRILAAMADQSRAYLRYFDDTAFQATLFLFSDKDLDQFLCRARARDNRPVGHRVRCKRSVAYFWAKRFPDRSSSVHDIKALRIFPQRLSDGAALAEYRSILILPLAERDPVKDSFHLRGVITLDSDRRYEFFGARRAELESLLEPHVRWILAITNDHPHVMTIEGRS